MPHGPRHILLLLSLAAVTPVRAQEPSAPEETWLRSFHEKTLRDRGLPTAGDALLNFFKERTLSAEQVKQFQAIIEQLHAPTYGTRVQADAELNKLARIARPVMIEALTHKEHPLETRRRLEVLLKNNPEGDEPVVAAALVFHIARAKPKDAGRTLLAYLPFARNPRVASAVREALPALAVQDGKPAASFKEALKHADPQVRAAAGEALVRAGGLSMKPLVAGLLKEEAQVRLSVLEALVEAKDKDAVSQVIDLFDQMARDDAFRAEEILSRATGGKGPGVYLSADTPPEKLEKAWHEWWAKNKEGVVLAGRDEEPPLLGNTLISNMSPERGINGKVMEVGPEKNVLWEISGLRYPVDVRLVGRERVLIAEYLSRRVTERDLKGNIVWEQQIDMPITCQRFPNGDTFIAGRRQLLLVDREGKELFSHFPTTTSISAAQRLRDGQTLFVNSGGMLTILDPAGKEVQSFQVGQPYTLGGNIDAAPGRILVPVYRENRVVEYNWEGKELWRAEAPMPISVSRLPGGNVLVVTQAPARVVEIDRAGKTAWSMDLEGRPWRARKR